MQGTQGILLIGIAIFLLWVGVTGRFAQLIQALGMVKGVPSSTLNTSQSPIVSTPYQADGLASWASPQDVNVPSLLDTSRYQAGGLASWANPSPILDPTLAAQFKQ